MSDTSTFHLQGMEKFSFQISELYSASHSQVFSLIAARDLAISHTDPNDDILFKDKNAFKDVAVAIAQQYLFGQNDMRERVFHSVENYLAAYPDERIRGFLEFSRKPENLPRIDDVFSGGMGNKSPSRKNTISKNKKKMSLMSKRKNRRK